MTVDELDKEAHNIEYFVKDDSNTENSENSESNESEKSPIKVMKDFTEILNDDVEFVSSENVSPENMDFEFSKLIKSNIVNKQDR